MTMWENDGKEQELNDLNRKFEERAGDQGIAFSLARSHVFQRLADDPAYRKQVADMLSDPSMMQVAEQELRAWLDEKDVLSARPELPSEVVSARASFTAAEVDAAQIQDAVQAFNYPAMESVIRLTFSRDPWPFHELLQNDESLASCRQDLKRCHFDLRLTSNAYMLVRPDQYEPAQEHVRRHG